ncbi:MAG: hypothetical protein ACI4LN_04705 [Anaerovoracaceae bacterium]
MAFLLTELKKQYVAFRGYHTDRHLVVVESDDWGSIRMPSYAVFQKLQEMGDNPEKNAFLSNDCLEGKCDLENLFEVLRSVTGSNQKHPVITANFAIANPDFDRIDVKNGVYAYESILDTYQRYYPNENVFSTIKAGMQEGVFFPQLHCREHVNVNRWMKDIAQKKEDAKIAFENKLIGIGASYSDNNRFGYMDAFNTVYSTDEELAEIVEDAAAMFYRIFGFQSKTFVASCFVWNCALEKKLAQLGIKGIQSSIWQNVPIGTNGVYQLKRRIHFTGEKNRFGQIYTVRNCTYEPAYKENPEESVLSCMEEVEDAFQHKKPAIITSHRVNYIGQINRKNAERNLAGLRELVTQIVEKYPDVEFVTSAELISIMEHESGR